MTFTKVGLIKVSILFKLWFKHILFQDYLKRYKKAKIRKRCNQKKIPTPKTEVGKKPNQQSGTETRKHFVSRMSSYFPNRFI